MVGNDGEREFLYTSPLELLATVAETVSDLQVRLMTWLMINLQVRSTTSLKETTNEK